MENEDFFDILLKILGNKTRRSMLELLSERPRFLSDISKELEIGQQAILRHIDEFVKAGILEKTEDTSSEDDRKIGRRPIYYRIAESKRIIIDITPERFDVDLVPAFLDDQEIKQDLKLKFCTELAEIDNEIDSLEKIMNPNERYKKVLELESALKNEINSLVDAKHYAEVLLQKLKPKKKTCEDFLGI
ncbi:MAG: ArsR/SmtB family transcription factor [Candidatus Helarchaeota archaeon]